MGQQQPHQTKPLNELIKDVATFNLLVKTQTLKNKLGKTLQAEVTKKQQNFFQKLQNINKEDDLCIGIHIDKKYTILTQEKFFYCKDLLHELASILYKPKKEDGTCQICFEKQIDKMLPCGHSYCEDCLEGWFIVKEQNSCPMCRAQLTKQKMQHESYCVPNEEELIESIKEQLFIQLTQEK